MCKSKSNYQSVKEFHQAFNHPVADKPTPLDKERNYTRSKWIAEEIIETLYASSDSKEDFIKQTIKLSEDVLKIAQETIDKNNNENPPQSNLDRIIGQVDGLVDALYFINGSFVELGVKPDAIFNIIQSANMAKLGEDGKPIIRESDGKIQKPKNWERDHAPEPRIKEEIENQILDHENGNTLHRFKITEGQLDTSKLAVTNYTEKEENKE